MQILIWGDNMNRKVSICILVFIFIVCAVVLFVMAKRSKDAPVPETKVTQLAETEDASVCLVVLVVVVDLVFVVFAIPFIFLSYFRYK